MATAAVPDISLSSLFGRPAVADDDLRDLRDLPKAVNALDFGLLREIFQKYRWDPSVFDPIERVLLGSGGKLTAKGVVESGYSDKNAARIALHHEILFLASGNFRLFERVDQMRGCIRIDPSDAKKLRLVSRGDTKLLEDPSYLDSDAYRVLYEKYYLDEQTLNRNNVCVRVVGRILPLLQKGASARDLDLPFRCLKQLYPCFYFSQGLGEICETVARIKRDDINALIKKTFTKLQIKEALAKARPAPIPAAEES
jgi:hypothetical protein